MTGGTDATTQLLRFKWWLAATAFEITLARFARFCKYLRRMPRGGFE